MRAATCFSGIGAPETAMPDWRWFWSAEVEPFPAAVHAARHPGAVNLGDVLADDFLQRVTGHGPIDVLVGGPPCQAFSIAGARGSLSDPRGNLSLRWVQIIHAVDPVWSVTENVPGWLSTGDNAFGCFLGAIVGHDAELRSPLDGGRWPDAGMVAGPGARAAWRVLDAQHFGVPQRRRRVFVVASSRAWADPASVLFEPKGMRRHPEAGREARERVASPLAAGSPRGSGYRNDADTADNLIAAFGGNNTAGPIDIATACNAHGGPHGRMDFETETFVACVTGEVTHTLTTRCGGRNAGEDGTGRGTPIIPCAFDARQSDVCVYGDRAAPLDTAGFSQAVAFSCKDHGADAGELAPTLRAMGHGESWQNGGGQVAVAFAENSRAEVRLEGGDGQTVGALKTGGGKPEQSYPAIAVSLRGREGGATAELGGEIMPSLRTGGGGGDKPHALTDMQVRRLLPVECERLQGFPRVRISAKLSVCPDYSDHPKSRAPAADPNLRSPSSAWNAGESAFSGPAALAEQASSASRPSSVKHAALHVLIDLERNAVELRSAEKSLWSASTADEASSSRLLMPLGSFVRLAAVSLTSLDRTARLGAAASPPHTPRSTVPWNGSNAVRLPGREIDELAVDAARFTEMANRCMKSITSEAGPNSPSYERTLTTSFCCVAAAIGSFIPEEIRAASSYDLEVEVVGGFTAIDYRGKPASDGPRYKAIGNSMCVNVMRWILRRVEAAHVAASDEERAA